jgi:Flp pilus assembly protein TadG
MSPQAVPHHGDLTCRPVRDETGAASVELTLVLPVFLLLCWLTIQAGVWWHGQQIAQTSADAGARAAHLLGADQADGEHTARAILDRYAGNLIRNPAVQVDRDANTVRVTVTGTALAVIPGLDAPVTAHATYPLPDSGSP